MADRFTRTSASDQQSVLLITVNRRTIGQARDDASLYTLIGDAGSSIETLATTQNDNASISAQLDANNGIAMSGPYLRPGWFSIPQVLVSVLVSANSIDTLTDTMYNTPHHHTFSFFSFLLLF